MKRINTLKELVKAAEGRRAVIVPKSMPWSKPNPASFIVHAHGTVIAHLLDIGIYLYEKSNNKYPKCPKCGKTLLKIREYRSKTKEELNDRGGNYSIFFSKPFYRIVCECGYESGKYE